MYVYRGNIYCSDDSKKNILERGSHFYQIKPLSNKSIKSKGGNSNVFQLIDPNDDINPCVIKFNKFKLESKEDWKKQRIERFEREIRSLEQAREAGFENVIQIIFDGSLKIGSGHYCYYVMEKADYDLTEYLEENEISVQQKILLCYEILKGIVQLHSLNIYHRDIKPDNIFIVNDKWKIGDLGLIDFQNSDLSIDIIREKIGPYGWLSPEAMNKVLCEGTSREGTFNCEIKSYSDIFQLGKLFWYIFQGNIPIGQIIKKDFLLGDENIFEILFSMLQYLDSRRPILNNISSEFERSFKKYAV